MTIRFIALHNTNRAPVVQSCSGIKQGVEGKLQLELMVHWARQSGGPQASIQVNRATVPEVEEGTISDITDNEEEDRYICRTPLSYICLRH